MSELRKMKKAVNKYVDLICLDPEKAKRNCEFYLEDVKKMQKIVDNYIDKTAKLFQDSCDTSVEIWDLPSDNLFSIIERSIFMAIVNHYLNKYSYELACAGLLQRNLKIVHERFNQFVQLLHYR